MTKFIADWAVMNSIGVGGVASVPSESKIACKIVLVRVSIAKTEIVVSLMFSPLPISRTGSLPSSAVLPVPSVGSRDRVSAGRGLIPAQCTKSKSNSKRRSCNRSSIPVASAKFKVHRSKSWSVRMVSRVLSRYEHRSSTDQTLADQSRWVIL